MRITHSGVGLNEREANASAAVVPMLALNTGLASMLPQPTSTTNQLAFTTVDRDARYPVLYLRMARAAEAGRIELTAQIPMLP